MSDDEEPEIDRISRKLAAENASRTTEQFDFQSIARDLEGVHQPILDAIWKAAGPEKGYPHILALTVTISKGTWESIRFLSLEQPKNGWHRQFVYSVPPLARTLLDSLFNVIFMFDNPSVNVHWFLVGGWTDQNRAHRLFRDRYGTEAEWKTWLDACEANIKQTEDHLVGITDAERKSPTKPPLGYWPNPGKMGNKDCAIRDPGREAFLKYVNAWFYKWLSGDSHLSLTGLLNRGGYLLPLAAAVDPEELYRLTRSRFVLTALTIYIALLSEISSELALAPELARLREIWKKLVVWPDAADLYGKRYDALLRQA
jgi:hypothetical protein